jgi:hypothetical protein
MSARKLSRFAGLVFVLAAILGGLGAQHAADSEQAVRFTSQTIDWT